MLKIQNKLFFKNTMRTFLIVLCFIGIIAYHIHILMYHKIDNITIWGSDSTLFMQLRVCFFYFVVMTFLSFDYFREIPDADLSETIRITGQSFHNDLGFFVVMLQFVLLSIMIMFAFGTYYFHISSTLTMQIGLYLLKVFGLYIGLSGILAILFGWFLARRLNKLLGYVVLLLFCISISTPMVQNIKLMCWGNSSHIVKYLRLLYFLPELEIPEDGTVMVYDSNLYPVQLSQISRILVWIFLCIMGIVSCYSICHKKKIMTISLCVGACNLWFVVQPTNAWCDSLAFDITASSSYPVEYYASNTTTQPVEQEAKYQIDQYTMTITPGWEMRVTARLHFTESETENYDMTLYHLYEIDNITNLTGEPLSYNRTGDYLTIEGKTQSLDGIIITYHGCNSCFYCNKSDIYLPAWFPYYPIAGFHPIFNNENFTFIDNQPKQEAQFDITFLSNQDIYSDLPEVEKNHFAGNSKSAMFISGFFRRTQLENGITCIYYYLNPTLDPYTSENQETIEDIAQYMVNSNVWNNTQDKTMFIVPHITGLGIPYITENTIADSTSWSGLKAAYEKSNSDETKTIEITPLARFTNWYNLAKKANELTYEGAKAYYNEVFETEKENADEEFDTFFVEQFGETELSTLKGE